MYVNAEETSQLSGNQSKHVTSVHFLILFSIFCPPPGSKGAFCELRQSDQRMLDFYTELDCFKHINTTEDLIVMGTSL